MVWRRYSAIRRPSASLSKRGSLPSKAENLLLYLCFAYFLVRFNGSVMFPLVRVYMVRIGASETEIGLVVASFGLFSAPLQTFFDRSGRKPLSTLGILSKTVSFNRVEGIGD